MEFQDANPVSTMAEGELLDCKIEEFGGMREWFPDTH